MHAYVVIAMSIQTSLAESCLPANTSNASSGNSSPHNHDLNPDRILLRKPSARNLVALLHLDSSEATPSDHGSIYDAGSAGRLSKQTSFASEKESGNPQALPEDLKCKCFDMTPPSNMAGTPLFTITEQHSMAMLTTKASS